MKQIYFLSIALLVSCLVNAQTGLDQNIYERNYRQLLTPSLLDKVEVISVEEFPKQDESCNNSVNKSFLTHTVGNLEDFLPFNGSYSNFSLSGNQNGLIFRSHSVNPGIIKYGNFINSIKNNIFQRGYFDINNLFETTIPYINPTLPQTQVYNCPNLLQNLFITRAGLFRDFLLSSRTARELNFKIVNKQRSASGQSLLDEDDFNDCATNTNNNIACGCDFKRQKTYNQLSNVTFFRVWFKVKPKQVGSASNLKLYANFKLLGELFNEPLSAKVSSDIFSIRIMEVEKSATIGLPKVNFPYIDETSGFTVGNCNSNTYVTIPVSKPPVKTIAVGLQPATYYKYFKPRRGLGQPIREVASQLIKLTEPSDVNFNALGFPYQSKVYSYECDLDYPELNADGSIKKEKLYSVIVGVADCGPKGFDDISALLVQLSDVPIIESVDPCGNEGYLGYTPPCCNTSFSPMPNKKYVVQGWYKLVKGSGTNVPTVSAQLNFGSINTPFVSTDLGESLKSVNQWVRFELPFTMPNDATLFELQLSIPNESGYKAYLDDLRIIPIDSEVKSYVYDSESGKLKTELDSQNYAVYFTYDETGRLVRTSKETSKGVKTINVKIEDE